MRRAPITLADRLKSARKKKNLSQLEVAQAAGLRPEVISRLETGKSPGSLPTLYKVAPVLGLTVEELVGDSAPKKGKGTK